MEWLKCESNEKTLKQRYGSLQNLRKVIKKDCKELIETYDSKDKNAIEMFKITSGSWKGIVDKIIIFKSIMKKLESDCSEGLFNCEEAEIIFYLLEIDGPKRAKALNIRKIQYSDKKEAKKWRDNLAKKIHPDICKIQGCDRAISKLNQLYEEMISCE